MSYCWKTQTDAEMKKKKKGRHLHRCEEALDKIHEECPCQSERTAEPPVTWPLQWRPRILDDLCDDVVNDLCPFTHLLQHLYQNEMVLHKNIL